MGYCGWCDIIWTKVRSRESEKRYKRRTEISNHPDANVYTMKSTRSLPTVSSTSGLFFSNISVLNSSNYPFTILIFSRLWETSISISRMQTSTWETLTCPTSFPICRKCTFRWIKVMPQNIKKSPGNQTCYYRGVHLRQKNIQLVLAMQTPKTNGSTSRSHHLSTTEKRGHPQRKIREDAHWFTPQRSLSLQWKNGHWSSCTFRIMKLQKFGSY